jgi:hypothetical protein
MLNKSKHAKNPVVSKIPEFLYILIMIVLLVTPWIIYTVFNPETFRGVDIYGYMPDSQTILQQGQIPLPGTLLENSYYATFPVFTLILSFLTAVSGLTALQGVYVLNVLIQALFWLSLWVLVKKNSGSSLHLVLFGIVVAAFANPYLYGYFNTPLPQTMGLCLLLLLFIVGIRKDIPHSILYIILILASLVHVTTIPLFLMILLFLFVLNFFTKQRSLGLKMQSSLNSLALPLILFLSYLFYTIALYSVSNYLTKIVGFMSDLTKDALSGQISLAEGLSRGPVYPLNALGPALIIGATLAYALLYLSLLRKHKETNNWLGAIAIASLLLIFLGTLRGQFDVWGVAFFSISRYFNLPGYALATVVTSFVVANSFKYDRRSKWLLVPFVLVILSVIGGLLDPLVF